MEGQRHRCPLPGLTDPPQPHRKNLPSPSGWLIASRSFLRFCSHAVNSFLMHLLGTRPWGPPPTACFRAFAGHSAPRGTFRSPRGRCTPHPTGFGLSLSSMCIPALSLVPRVTLTKFLFSASLCPHLDNEDMLAACVW